MYDPAPQLFGKGQRGNSHWQTDAYLRYNGHEQGPLSTATTGNGMTYEESLAAAGAFRILARRRDVVFPDGLEARLRRVGVAYDREAGV